MGKAPIGIFDSGVGGLTVLRQVMKELPREDVIYLADTARVPYGSRSPQEIIQINQQINQFLVQVGVKTILIACGTSSAIAYPVLKDQSPIPLVGLIEPGSRAALRASRSGKIGVIATEATTRASSYPRTMKELQKGVEVYAQACPMLVPLIEGGFMEAPETKETLREYLTPLIRHAIDTLLLGCTHYPHLETLLRHILDSTVTLVDPAIAMVQEAKKMLVSMGLLRSQNPTPSIRYFVTGSPLSFQETGSKLLRKPMEDVRLVTLPT